MKHYLLSHLCSPLLKRQAKGYGLQHSHISSILCLTAGIYIAYISAKAHDSIFLNEISFLILFHINHEIVLPLILRVKVGKYFPYSLPF